MPPGTLKRHGLCGASNDDSNTTRDVICGIVELAHVTCRTDFQQCSSLLNFARPRGASCRDTEDFLRLLPVPKTASHSFSDAVLWIHHTTAAPNAIQGCRGKSRINENAQTKDQLDHRQDQSLHCHSGSLVRFLPRCGNAPKEEAAARYRFGRPIQRDAHRMSAGRINRSARRAKMSVETQIRPN